MTETASKEVEPRVEERILRAFGYMAFANLPPRNMPTVQGRNFLDGYREEARAAREHTELMLEGWLDTQEQLDRGVPFEDMEGFDAEMAADHLETTRTITNYLEAFYGPLPTVEANS